MKKYKVTLWFKPIKEIGFQGCFSYETVTAPSNTEARKFAKENLLAFRGYTAKIISVRVQKSS